MISLTMMGMTPSPLVRVLLPLVLMIMLVVTVAWGMAFFFQKDLSPIGDVVKFVLFIPIGVESKGGQLIEMFWHSNS